MNKQFETPEESQPKDINLEELRDQPHLEVYEKHFILADATNNIVKVWTQGKQSKEAQERYKKVQDALQQGFFLQKIEEAQLPEVAEQIEARLSEVHKKALEEIIGAVTDQAGRALVDILVLQLVVKSICPEQDIRLHKANNNPHTFSWTEGISMRSLDSGHIIPSLRAYDLLRINQYGGYMTRSFAENYPYTLFYKAEIRGARRQGKQRWLEIVDDLENGKLDAQTALLYVLQLLWKYSEAFSSLAQRTLNSLETWISKQQPLSLRRATELISQHFEKSETKARLLEVAIHAFLQAKNDLEIDLGGSLKALMPMRTGNKKHGNVGDVEVLIGDLIIEAWDAKYDQPYLSDAIDELVEKMRGIDTTALQFGYILYPIKKEYAEVERKIEEIYEEFGVKIQILTLDEWIQQQFVQLQGTAIREEQVVETWLRAYTESLCLRRRDLAPIDEPTFLWVSALLSLLT